MDISLGERPARGVVGARRQLVIFSFKLTTSLNEVILPSPSSFRTRLDVGIHRSARFTYHLDRASAA
jgi:hypothetical protein